MSKLKEFAEFLLEVEKDGGRYQVYVDSTQTWLDCGYDSSTALNLDSFENYHIRLIPKEEEKKKIPLSFEDITPNMVFSAYNNKGWFKIYSANKYGVESPVQDKHGALSYYTYEDLMKYYYSEDGKTWKGCYKYED